MNKPPQWLLDKAVAVNSRAKRNKDDLEQINVWLAQHGYNIDDMLNLDSFQVFIQYGELEDLDAVIHQVFEDLERFDPENK